MSCNSAFSFTLIRKTLTPIYSSSTSTSISNLFFLSHRKLLSFTNSAPLSPFLLAGDLPEFPHNTPIPQPSIPLEVPPISSPPEIDPPGGPDFPEIPTPSPPGPEFPVPPAPSPSPRRPPDIEPPKIPEELPPRPFGPDILT